MMNLKREVEREKEGKMKKLWIISLVLGVLLVAGFGIAYAVEDDDIQTSGVSLVIPETADLDVTLANSSKTLAADGSSEIAFDTGYVDMDDGYPTLEVSANKGWKLSAKSSGFGHVGLAAPAGYDKAIGDLQLKSAGAAHATMIAFASLSAVNQQVATHTVGVKDESHPCQYRILLDWTKDIPGTYNATVTYTLVTEGTL